MSPRKRVPAYLWKRERQLVTSPSRYTPAGGLMMGGALGVLGEVERLPVRRGWGRFPVEPLLVKAGRAGRRTEDGGIRPARVGVREGLGIWAHRPSTWHRQDPAQEGGLTHIQGARCSSRGPCRVWGRRTPSLQRRSGAAPCAATRPATRTRRGSGRGRGGGQRRRTGGGRGLHPDSSTLDPMNPKPETRNPKPETRSPKP